VFWDQVIAAFDRLGSQVTPEDRKRFEAAIAAKVRRPSAAQYEAEARRQAVREAERARGIDWEPLEQAFARASKIFGRA